MLRVKTLLSCCSLPELCDEIAWKSTSMLAVFAALAATPDVPSRGAALTTVKDVPAWPPATSASASVRDLHRESKLHP